MADQPFADPASTLITPTLYERATGSPDLEAELRAYHELSSLMAVDPIKAIQRFLDLAVELCPSAGSAGLSELVSKDDGELFEWTAMSGDFAGYVGGTTPRDFSPCGLCLDRHHTILVERPGRIFTYFNDAEPEIIEGLIVPLYDTGKVPIGTLWVVSHEEGARFDPNDARVMEQLAVQLVLAIKLRRKAEIRLALQDAVHDRDLLIEEVRHRVKNMLQMTTALLKLQEGSVSSEEARSALRDAQGRLSVLSGVYEVLLEPGNGDTLTVELDVMLPRLVSALVGNSPVSNKIEVKVNCAPMSLGVPEAASVGLIANEAITNALKYAFSDRGEGMLQLDLRQEAERCSLTISDDGPGLDGTASARSLGIRLMKRLASQVGGNLTIDGSAGTTVCLKWVTVTSSEPLAAVPAAHVN